MLFLTTYVCANPADIPARRCGEFIRALYTFLCFIHIRSNNFKNIFRFEIEQLRFQMVEFSDLLLIGKTCKFLSFFKNIFLFSITLSFLKINGNESANAFSFPATK